MILRALETPAGDEASTDMLARERLAAKNLEPVAARLRAAGLSDVEVLVRTGKAADRIIDVATQRGASLIAMATHGSKGIDRLVLGSVFDRVVRTAPVPVLAVNPVASGLGQGAGATAAGASPEPTFARTIVPYDGSEIAFRSVDALAKLGEAGRAKVTLLGVVETFGELSNVKLDGPTDDLRVRYLQLLARDLRTDVEHAAERARALGFEVDIAISVGPPAQRIIDKATDVRATAIAMTTHGRSGLARLALGSVTEKVVRVAPIPVLVSR
jgi:nucleotide-binding universal stress UspA family protein